MLLATASVASAKPSIAVLGLEVIDKSGTPTEADTQVAKELTTGLRSRAKAGSGPYQLAPNSEKELIDEKLLKNCDDEKEKCMSAIGGELGADILMYGRIEKQGGAYNVSVQMLDVKRKVKEKITVDQIPIAEASGAALQGWAKKIYGKLTGQTEGCTIVVKTTGPDRATILVGSPGEEKGNITAGSGQVQLPEGRYTIAVEAKDYKRWENTNVTCTAGQTTSLQADMVKGSGGDGSTGVGPGGTDSHEITGTISHDSGPWKNVAIGGAIATGVLAIGFGYTWHDLSTTGKIPDGQPNAGFMQYGQNCVVDAGHPNGVARNGASQSACDHAPTFKTLTYVTGIAAIAAGGITLFAIVKTVTGSSASSEHASNSHRVKKPDFVVTPVIAPNGAGATLQIDW